MQLSTQVLNTGGRPTRHTRKPVFPIAGTMTPYGLYPILAHPVLPGETLQSASLKMKTVSMPLVNPIEGAWLETWLVYVKLTDIDPDLATQFIQDTTPTGLYGADSDRYFAKTGQVAWIKNATLKFHEAYFKHETEPTEDLKTIDGVPRVKLNNRSWYQNMMFKPADDAVPTNDASDLYKHLSEYRILQQMSMVEMTYEKYLEQYGAKPAKETEGDPEILRFARSWVTPANTVDPSTGAPSSAWLWKDDVTLDKPKRFTEPGFVMAFATIRPKLYQANLASSLIGNQWGFSDWYPIYNQGDPTLGIKSIQTDDAVFAAGSRTDVGELEMIYDHRDLLAHGEQFVNNFSPPYALPVTGALTMEDAAAPEDLRGEYPAQADINALFAGTDKVCYYGGMGFLTISGHVVDGTPM